MENACARVNLHCVNARIKRLVFHLIVFCSISAGFLQENVLVYSFSSELELSLATKLNARKLKLHRTE